MEIYLSADRGGHSAWKGFSSQTTYIANRLIFEKDISLTYYPESIEDLKIQDQNGSVVELIQVKNLSSKLALSDLRPQKEGSFLKRALSVRQNNPNLKVCLVSYGDIGPELLNWNNNAKAGGIKDSITDKLESYGYTTEDTRWLGENILIEKHDELELENLIFTELEKNIETVISPRIAFDILINHVSRLSRYQMGTSRVDWYKKLRVLSLSLASISGWKNQFGKTILPLSEYRNFNSCDIELHRREYENGVNALPQHIFNNFDILRPYWLDVLDRSYKKHNLTIIHGSSGQGKSSLAYRYLFDNYAANEVFVVSGISNQQQALDIGAALRELEKNEFNMIVYIDVRPYDSNWVWLIEQIYTLNLSMPVLVTLREEDFNRNPIDKNYIKYNDIQLMLNEVEARDLYERYPTDKYLSFEESWKNFGEYNLLMEYIFFLRENESLKTRLQSQIDRLILEEENIDNWLSALLIISYAGRKEVPINAKKLLKGIKIKNHHRMLLVFSQEYWVRSIDGISLSSLHPVRAMLLYDILIEKNLITEEEVLLQSIQFTNYYPKTLLIDYFYLKPADSDFIEKLSGLSYTTWGTYAGVLESILWLSVWKYYKKHETIIEQGNLLTNNTFAPIMITNITGYLKFDNQYMLDILEKQNPKMFHKAKKLLDSIEGKTINYMLVDEFLKNTADKLPLDDVLISDSLTYCGFTLFWFAKRDIFLKESIFINVIDKVDYSDNLAVSELILGIQKQGWQKVYNRLLERIKPLITKQLNIVYLNDKDNILRAYVINNIFGDGSNHKKIMLAVDVLSMLYDEKEEYHVTLIGSDIIEGIPVYDNIKTIKKENLPYKWITRLNGWFIKIDEYKYLLDNWKDIYDEILNKRQEIQEIASHLAKAIDGYFKNKKINRFFNKEYIEKENKFKIGNYILRPPKCATNMYGMSTGISNFTDITFLFKEETEQQQKYQGAKEYLSVLKAYNDYTRDFQYFLTQKSQLLADKMQNRSISDIGRSSYVNLMFLLEKLPKMLSLFETEFSKFISMNTFDKNEEEALFLLGIMWEYVYNVPPRTEGSIIYSKKKEVNAKKDIIQNFIDKAIGNLQGVEQVVYSDNREVFVLLDILYAESFIEDIYVQFMNRLQQLEYGTWNFALVSLLIKKINIQYCYNSIPTIGGFEIRILDFTKEDEESFLESVVKTSIGFDNYHWDISNSRVKYIFTILGLIENFNLIYRHVQDVIDHLTKIENDKYLQIQVLDSWKITCDSITKDLFKDINKTCELLQACLMDKTKKDILCEFVKVTNSLHDVDDLFLNLVVNKDKLENELSIDDYKGAFTGMVDLLLAE